MAKQNIQAQTKSMRGMKDCRVVEVGVEKFAECLQQGPNTCSYALPFGYCFRCQHPQLDQIIENTKKTQSVQKL